MYLLHFLDILSELIQLVFELGVYTRRYILPTVVFVYVAAEFTYNKVMDKLTTQQVTLHPINTPLTTGLA